MKIKQAFAILLLLPVTAFAGCSAGAGPDGASEEAVESVGLAIQPEDRNRCCFPQIDTPVECNARDGVFELSSGVCTIIVEQRCQLVTAPSGEVGCCCKVKVLDTMAGCDNKDWSDFYDKCQM